jgi:RNA polymerase sigma-70 factor (ECF subfamily)
VSDRAAEDAGAGLLALYDRGLPDVFGYLLARCGQRSVAEELTSETFMAAVDAVRRGGGTVSMPWLIGVARHKLVDAVRARETLAQLGAHHRAALTLRYLDDLPVPQVAALLDRTVHATEALLVRAKTAFRRAYTAGGGCDA